MSLIPPLPHFSVTTNNTLHFLFSSPLLITSFHISSSSPPFLTLCHLILFYFSTYPPLLTAFNIFSSIPYSLVKSMRWHTAKHVGRGADWWILTWMKRKKRKTHFIYAPNNWMGKPNNQCFSNGVPSSGLHNEAWTRLGWQTVQPKNKFLTDWLHCSRCKINVEIYIIELLDPHCSRAPTSICVAKGSAICDADRAASPASPISSLVYRSRYPRAISSLVIPTWVTERQTRLVI